MLKWEEGVLAVEEKEGVDYHTFIKIEFILENLKQEIVVLKILANLLKNVGDIIGIL